ncbi:unnamed protein product [Effrenium voratum]|nr:unnamed protein product [Effrenium voratum]
MSKSVVVPGLDVFQNLSAEELVEKRREKLQHLVLWRKLNDGQLYQVTVKDVEELFAIFDVEGFGEISLEELMEIKKVKGLVLSAEDVQALGRDADKDGSGLVSVNELYKALTQGEVAYNLIKKSINEESFISQMGDGECLIDDLIEFMRHEYETNSDLWSLPQTLLLFAVFQYCSASHVPMRFGWETARNYAARGTAGFYRLEWIFDNMSLFDYLKTSFLDQHVEQDLDLYTPGRYFGRSQIVGGMRFRRSYTEPQNCSVSQAMQRVYYPFPLRGLKCYKLGAEQFEDRYLLYHERRSWLTAQLDEMSREYWLDDNTTELSIDSVLMNPNTGTYTFEQLEVRFETNGFLRHIQYAETFLVEPYKEWTDGIGDVIFIVVLMRIMYGELKELLPALSTGLDGIANYLAFWNMVDWLVIIWGLLCAGLWLITCMQIGSLIPVLAELPLQSLDDAVYANRSYLHPWEVEAVLPRNELTAQLGSMFNAVEAAAIWHQSVRVVCVTYLFVLMMKFFKSFKANALLNVVISTLAGSVKDVSHFAIVFLTIFLCYAWGAHVFFGWSIEGASSVLGSVFWRWSSGVGMGDMEDLSTTGRAIGYIYTLSYEFLVLNLLLGILFGLIFEAYGRTKQKAGNAESLIMQVRKSVAETRKKKDFLDEYYMICELEDDQPAHPGEIVTVRTLCEAFRKDGFTKEYIITQVRAREFSKVSEVEVRLVDALKLVALMRTASLRAILRTEAILNQLKAESQRPQELRFRCIMAGYDPDEPEEMKEFIHASQMEELDDDQPMLPNVPVPAQVHAPQESKVSVNSRTFSADVPASKEVNEQERAAQEEATLKVQQLLLKAATLSNTARSLQSQQDKSVLAVQKELEAHTVQSVELTEDVSKLDREMRGLCAKAQEGSFHLEERFRSTDLKSLQELPDRVARLADLAKASRRSVEHGKPGFGSDPLKRLEGRLGVLSQHCRTFQSQAEAQQDLTALLRRLVTELNKVSPRGIGFDEGICGQSVRK